MDKEMTPVKLRKRKMSSGNTSLYLDIYIHGKRRYEYLRLYLIPEKTREDKRKNIDTLRLAEAVKAKRIVEVRNKTYGFASDEKHVPFFDFVEEIIDSHKDSIHTCHRLRNTLWHIRQYEHRKNITLNDITHDWILGFQRYLDATTNQRKKVKQPLQNSTKDIYLKTLNTILNCARKKGYISESPFLNIETYKKTDSDRQYLTIEEIRILASTKCPTKLNIKSAFLFSCLTGLRWSDVSQLRWEDVHTQGNFTRIIFRQQKTRRKEYLDITQEAVLLMGERPKDNNSLIFQNLGTSSCANRVIKKWVRMAKIDKHITFHCARHTFAVMMLDLGVDIYTVSKLLGHTNLTATQIYAKILDKNKQKAVSSIPSIFNNLKT